MRTSGIIYHHEWETEEESVSIRTIDQVVSFNEQKDFDTNVASSRVSGFERVEVDTLLIKYSGQREKQQITVSNIETINRGSDSERVVEKEITATNQNRDFSFTQSVPREAGDVIIDEYKKKENEYNKRKDSTKNNQYRNQRVHKPELKTTKPRKVTFWILRILFGIVLFIPLKLLRKIKSRKLIGFPFRFIERTFKKVLNYFKKTFRILRLDKTFRIFQKMLSFLSKIIKKSLGTLFKTFRVVKIWKILSYPFRIFYKIFRNILKTIKQPFKIANKDRTSRVIKSSAKYSKKTGKAMFKGTKWFTIKSLKLIPPTLSLSYRGAKKIKNNDILLRLVLAAIIGIVFLSFVFAGFELY